jgi:hypothetical protein
MGDNSIAASLRPDNTVADNDNVMPLTTML